VCVQRRFHEFSDGAVSTTPTRERTPCEKKGEQNKNTYTQRHEEKVQRDERILSEKKKESICMNTNSSINNKKDGAAAPRVK
jgi:hypothetical protein